MKQLDGKIAVVAGATRGAGRGIACMLGDAGATVYCTGRSTRDHAATPGRTETIDETAELVDQHGGKGIAVQVDHTESEQVEAFFDRLRAEQGQLDILVNDIWGGDELMDWAAPFWGMSLENGRTMFDRAVWSHIITSRFGVPLMVEKKSGLIIEITDGDSYGYRANLLYDLMKTSAIRLAYAMSVELRKENVTAVALTPGFLRSEAMLDHFGVTESNWQDAVKQDEHFIASETPFYVGRAVAALAADPKVHEKSGRVFSSWGLAEEYGFTDVDGRQPHWDRHLAENAPEFVTKKCDDAFYEYWVGAFDDA